MFLMLPLLFLYHCNFYCFIVVLLLFLLLQMPLLLHILSYYYNYCGMGIIVINFMGQSLT